MRALTLLLPVLAVVAVGCGADPAAPRSDSPPTTSASTPGPTPGPAGLAALPVGAEPTEVAWVEDDVLHVGGTEHRLRDPDVTVSRGLVLVRERSTGRVTAYGDDAGRVVVLAEDSVAPALGVPGGTRVVVPREGPDGRARLDLVELSWDRPAAGARLLDSQVLPVPCCDGDLRLLGITQFRDVVVDSSAGPWVWSSDEGQEGNPEIAPDSDTHIQPAETDGGELVEATVAGNLLLAHPVDGGLVRYELRPAPFSSVTSGGLDVELHPASIANGGDAAVEQLPDGTWRAVALRSGTRTPLDLPTGVEASVVAWDERDRSVLLDARDDEARALVRCVVRTGACEVAVPLSADAVVPS